MKTLVRLILFLPLAIVLIGFALANRQNVTLGLDPFATVQPSGGMDVPLFIIAFAALMLGVLIGGFAAWLGQGRHRRAARIFRAEALRLRENAAVDVGAPSRQ